MDMHLHRRKVKDRFMQCHCTVSSLQRISDSTNISTGAFGFGNNESQLYIAYETVKGGLMDLPLLSNDLFTDQFQDIIESEIK